MGSIHSGRRGGSPIVEDCLALDIAWLMRLGPIKVGSTASGEVVWSSDGQRIGAIRFRLDLRHLDAARLILRYALTLPDGQSRAVCQKIDLTSTTPHFGGRRWWMRCPVTGARVRKLYLPSSGDRFAGRKAGSLGYRVERINHFDRPFEKLFRAQRRLGGAQGLAMGLERPKGMWRRTHARHLDRFAEFDLACAMELRALIEKSGATVQG